jgi:hypothetical protein
MGEENQKWLLKIIQNIFKKVIFEVPTGLGRRLI